MPFEMKDNTGAIFPNKRKREDRQPDYTGECLIAGHKLQIAAWKRVSKNGVQYLSISFREPKMNDIGRISNKVINRIDEDIAF